MSWLPVIVTVPPASEPVTLNEVKAQCRIDGSDSDTLLTTYIAAARAFVELYTATKLVSQTVEMRCSSWCDLSDLPIAPIISVSSVTYQDPDAATQTLSTSIYESVTIGLEPHIRLKLSQSWPALRGSLGMPGAYPSVSDAIIVTATAGYSSIPDPVKAAIMLIVSSWYDNRNVGPIPDGAYALLDTNYRRF